MAVLVDLKPDCADLKGETPQIQGRKNTRQNPGPDFGLCKKTYLRGLSKVAEKVQGVTFSESGGSVVNRDGRH